MSMLYEGKNAVVQGIEIDEGAVYKCVERGLSVFHGDIDSGLAEYPDKSFDYIILNQTLQQAKKVEFVLDEALRVGKSVVIGFPNFAFFKARFDLFFLGRAPVTKSLPYRWYDTPNLHFLSIKDFKRFCIRKDIRVAAAYYLCADTPVAFWPNLFASSAIFVITK